MSPPPQNTRRRAPQLVFSRAHARQGAQVELLQAPGSLLAEVVAVAAEQARPNTQRAYAASYRALTIFATGRTRRPEDVDRDLVVAFRDHLQATGAASSTVSVRLSAIRKLADALELDPRIQRFKTAGAEPTQIPALTPAEYAALLGVPDLRTTAGRRDRAIIRLGAEAGLRRSEIVRLDLDEIIGTRQPKRLRDAITERRAETTTYAVLVRDAKGRSSGTVPLSRATWQDLKSWAERRPTSPSGALFLSLQRGQPQPRRLSPDAIADITAKHGSAAGLPQHLHAPHVLRHTFCTRLAEDHQPLDVIRDLARHRDIRTTQRYIHVTDTRRRDAIEETFRAGRGAL